MEIQERLSSLSKRVPQLVEILDTEEATKNALVLPFLAALGYDVFNPAEGPEARQGLLRPRAPSRFRLGA